MAQQFFPIKNWLGFDHKSNGVTVEDGTITLNKASGYRNASTSFKLHDIAHVAHVVKFRFLFLLVVAYSEFINSIALMNAEGQVLGTIVVPGMGKKHLLALLQTIKEGSPKATFDIPTSQALTKQSIWPLTKNYMKATFRGMLWLFVVLFIIIVGVMVISNLS